MKDATVSALRFIPGRDLKALAGRCNLPSLAAKLADLSGTPRAAAIDPHLTPRWLADLAAGLTDEEAAALDALVA